MPHSTPRIFAICLFTLAGACVSTTTTVPTARPPTALPASRPSQPPLTPLGDIDPMYFGRATRFDIVDGDVVAVDATGTRTITMDPLPETIFAWADGQHTVAELLEKLAALYEDGPPPDFNNRVRFVVRSLERQSMIRLNPTAFVLPSYLAQPVSQQNPTETRKEMQRDAVGEPQRGNVGNQP